MSVLKVVVHPAVIAETKAAVIWYRERSIPAARAFLAELERAFSRIAERPGIWPPYKHGTQRYLLRHFPYFIAFRVAQERVEIIAVGHTKRKPGYWQVRLG